jgi:hypothetical protein
MAIYVPPSRRRRRLVLTGLVCLVVGVAAGLLVGRASVTTTSERIATVRTEANDIATRIGALTIEYEQALAGQGDSVQAGVLDALDGIDRDVASTLAAAEWLSPSARATVEAAVNNVRKAATARVSAQAFADQTTAAATTIRNELVPAAAG